jgi:hypothetical protein
VVCRRTCAADDHAGGAVARPITGRPTLLTTPDGAASATQPTKLPRTPPRTGVHTRSGVEHRASARPWGATSSISTATRTRTPARDRWPTAPQATVPTRQRPTGLSASRFSATTLLGKSLLGKSLDGTPDRTIRYRRFPRAPVSMVIIDGY